MQLIYQYCNNISLPTVDVLCLYHSLILNIDSNADLKLIQVAYSIELDLSVPSK